MWSTVRSACRPLLRLRKFKRPSRTFLSSSYPCIDEWNRRFESPLLSQINPSDMFLELDQKYQSGGQLSAIDVDIYANTVKDEERLDELVDILHKLRLTMQTTNTPDSTHHAVIRYLLSIRDKQTLWEVLNDRLNYGIFPDYFCYNLMMDTFIKEKDFATAAKIATLLMLQEDNGHTISSSLAIYSCHKYLEKTDGWLPPPPPPPPNPKEEVVKVRVGYLRNPYFDDHFDLKVPKHLVGKTFVFFGKHMLDDAFGRSLLLRGYILWQKYDKAAELLKSWVDTDLKEVVYKDVIELVQKELDSIEQDKVDENIEKIKNYLAKLHEMNLIDANMEKEMENRIKTAVEQQEKKDIDQQCQNYKNWEKIRMEKLEEQLAEIDKQKRIQHVEEMKKDLYERERLLTFFENEEKIELQIEKKLKMEEEKYGPPIEIQENLDENYIPPDVKQRTNNP